MQCLRTFITRTHKNYIHNTIAKQYYAENVRISASQIEDESDKIVSELCKGKPEQEKKLRILMLEVEVMRQDGRLAPESLKTEQWKRLMDLSSRNQRSNYLTFLWKTEKKKENNKARKEARRLEFENSDPEETKEHPDDLLYGIKHQSLFLRIRDQSINNFDNYRAIQALSYGQKTVIDCSYEEHMVYREITNAAKQMTFVFGDNRMHKAPFNLHLCNVNLEGEFMKQLRKNIPSLEEPWFPLNIHTESYLDLFPRNQLVYLTPHCREELTTYDHNAIYIVGCMVDKMNNEPLSLAKAKRDGIKMAKLPLDRYLEWAPGSKKNLNINHMIPILLDLSLTEDWEFSLRHIPRRKLMETKIKAMQNRLKKTPLAKEDILRSFQSLGRKNLPTKQKFSRSIKSLFDDDKM